MLEKEIERKLVKQIEKQGGLCWKFVSPNLPGVPDRIVILPNGRIIFVELKTEIGRLSRLQDYCIGQLRARGCDARIIKGQAALNEFLKEVKNSEENNCM